MSPSIPITLRGSSGSFSVVAVLDSGADFTAFSKEVAELIGVDLSGPPHPTFGIGGKVKAVLSSVIVNITKGHENYNFKIPVIVIDDLCDFGVLLGRQGFFDKFKITFDQKNKKISFKRNS